ncbi:ATP-binding protein [Burkholderia cenocepacia]|uniref:AAA family ATPase n=1 Tax=Burkholderia cenocepacia TaxID=95486 RepID=UPI001B92AF0D|nr:ATP-binding protein [Burkholderia cenocepacia]MBR8396264.1 ATP-binding protein [Burkholderia cenocepacia]
MLIEFSVSNFRSFRERQTFQMTASPRLGKKENTFEAVVIGEKLPRLLKVAAIYGGNASGKTSLLRAMGISARLTSSSTASSTWGQLPVSPFRFDPELIDKPSEFEWHFIAEKCRYQYKIAGTQSRIFEEILTAYPRGKESLLYKRTVRDGIDFYEFGSTFEADEALRSVWQRLTGPRTPFIVQAVANSSEELQQLRTPLSWLQTGLLAIDDGLDTFSTIGRNLAADKTWASSISSFLQEIDVPVTDIHFEKVDSASEGRESASGSSSNSSGLLQKPGRTTFTHETRLGSAKFDFSEESKGTQNLVGVFVPWQFLQLSADQQRGFRTLVIDEFDASLHPVIVEDLVRKQIKSEACTQLIFTTHDTHLMSAKLLRRDQFWLTDRNANGATRLGSIHDYDGREGEDVERRYYEGLYRGLPIRRRG